MKDKKNENAITNKKSENAITLEGARVLENELVTAITTSEKSLVGVYLKIGAKADAIANTSGAMELLGYATLRECFKACASKADSKIDIYACMMACRADKTLKKSDYKAEYSELLKNGAIGHSKLTRIGELIAKRGGADKLAELLERKDKLGVRYGLKKLTTQDLLAANSELSNRNKDGDNKNKVPTKAEVESALKAEREKSYNLGETNRELRARLEKAESVNESLKEMLKGVVAIDNYGATFLEKSGVNMDKLAERILILTKSEVNAVCECVAEFREKNGEE